MRSGLRLFAMSVLAALAAGACTGESAPATPPPPPATAVYDAAPATPDGTTAIGGFDPSSGMHLDDDTPSAPRIGAAAVHSHRTLEILLRSQPMGATVAVDGVIVGQTPAYWEGEFTGREREFTFVMPGYAMARYRFVPTTNGVVHGRLLKIVSDLDAGAPAIPRPADLTGAGAASDSPVTRSLDATPPPPRVAPADAAPAAPTAPLAPTP